MDILSEIKHYLLLSLLRGCKNDFHHPFFASDLSITLKIKEVKTLKSKKDELEKNIVCYINENNLQESVFNISSLDTKLQYHKSSVKESITLKFLENSLLKYFENDFDKTNELMDFIKNNRSCSDKISLKRN